MIRPPSVLARLRAKARLDVEHDEGSGERERFAASPAQKLAWLGSETLRAPTKGHVDIVVLGRRGSR